MNINRPLMPGFLKRAEQKLLLNKPLIYSTRVHLVLYYGILFNLLLTGLCFIAPMNLMENSNAGYWIGFVIMIALIGLTVWLIYLLRFNVFKKYGNVKPLYALVTFLLYFVSTGIIVLSVFIYPAVESVRANRAFGNDELVHDVNALNINLSRYEYDLLNTNWDYDTIALAKKVKPVDKEATDGEIGVAPNDMVMTFPRKNYYKLDSTVFKERLAQTDSVVKLNDSMYLLYKVPALQFVSCYFLDDDEHSKEKVLSSFEIYNKALRQAPTPDEKRAAAKELFDLQRKYLHINSKSTDGYQLLPEDTPFDIVRKKHWVGAMNSDIWNIFRKKDSFSGKRLGEAIRIFYYFTLGITLLIFIFRHTTVRTFFLSLLCGVLLTIFTALMMSITNGDENAFMGWMISYTLLFFTGSIFTFSLTRRNAVIGILTNLFVFIIPVLPLLATALYCKWKKDQYYKENGVWLEFDHYFVYAEIGGTVLLLVLLATYINKVYRRWYSLPEH